jgi:Holliday junction DNA helicase RuvA
MIAFLKGYILKKNPDSVIVETSGVGYEVYIPLSTFYSLPEPSEEVNLHIYTHVREDTISLFGFSTEMEKQIFMLLISISGIGPKLALNILSGIGPDELLSAIANSDTGRIQSIPGVGKKTAQRIALELKEKVSLLGVRTVEDRGLIQRVSPEHKSLMNDALSALVNLGYPAKSAKIAVEKAYLRSGEYDLEGLIKESLRMLVSG